MLPLPVIDRTGAGDGFSATLMAAVQLGRPLRVAMAWGTVQAAHVVGVFGATPGLLTRRRILTEVGLHPELIAQEF